MLNTISAILQAAAANPEKRTIAVAAAHDRDVLEAVAQARRAGIAQAVLTGNGENIRVILQGLGENPADYALVEADSDAQCAALAVAEVREGRANFSDEGPFGHRGPDAGGDRPGHRLAHWPAHQPRDAL